MIRSFVFAGIITVILFIVRPRSRDYMAVCLARLKTLEQMRLESIMDYITEDVVAIADQKFWLLSKGLDGVFSRIGDLRPILTVVQAGIALEYLNGSQGRRIYVLALKQIGYSMLSVPEALACWILPYPHVMALRAARSHYEVTALTVTLFPVERLFGPNALL